MWRSRMSDPDAESVAEIEDDKAKSSEAGSNGHASSISPLEEKIIRQIEYYFGDRNMPRDKFLQRAAESGKDGYVPIATLLTFNRLKALSSNEQLIANAARKSASDVVQVSEDGTGIRRHPDKPLPDIFSPDLRKVIKSKTVYVKGFPEDTTLDKLQSFFEGFGKVECIQMRRKGADEGRLFKGSVFVEFTEQNSSDEFLALPTVKFGEMELQRESKEDYFHRKNNEKKAKKGIKAELSEEAVTTRPPVVKQKGCVLHFKGCGEKPTWEAIKESLSEYATVAYVEFSSDDRSEGYVRFKEEGGAGKTMEGLTCGDDKPKLLGVSSELRVLEGTEEEEYWAKLEASKKNKGHKRKFKPHMSRGNTNKPPSNKQPKTEN